MGIDDLFNRYQQKIAKYDKQRWETRIEQTEQKIIGLNHIPMRSTKPNTDLIDLDLIRGSSFAKAKPQHGFLTVAKLATLRFMLLPFYGKWWIQQTSKNVFVLILVLYLTQVINIIVYSLYNNSSEAQNLSCMEFVVPFIMMWILSLIHSQIVATNLGLDSKKSDSNNQSRQYRRRRNNFRQQRSKEKLGENRTDSTNSIKCKKLKFNDVVHVADIEQRIRSHLNLALNAQHDDDGFESLNGNGSRTSEEEVVPIFNKVQPIDNKTKHECDKSDLNVEVENKDASNCSSCKKCKTWIKQISDSKFKRRVISTDSESEKESDCKKPTHGKRRNSRIPVINILNTCDTEDETISSPEIRHTGLLQEDMLSSANEWTGITTNSEDCSITDTDTDDVVDVHSSEYISMDYDNDLATTGILNSSSVKVSCIIWERNEIKKADLSMLDISSAIIGKVESMPETMDYFYVGMVISAILAFLPCICLFCNCNSETTATNPYLVSDLLKNVTTQINSNNAFEVYKNVGTEMLSNVLMVTLGTSIFERSILLIALFQRWILAAMFFFLLSVAERTFKQRLLYAKLFSHLTSSRRARKSELPHFRLNKVRNIKTWLSVRSYLKKRGPQRSVDVIVSTSFAICLLLLIFLCFELLKETINFSQYYLEALIWCLGLGIFLLRFMTLGTKINKKYRNLSVLITEQINLHLKIEQKPHKKEELNVANNVLKLAIDLLKELESPFKISGLSANPILYNVTKLIILSALSGVLSEMLGFKLKLHKIKLK